MEDVIDIRAPETFNMFEKQKRAWAYLIDPKYAKVNEITFGGGGGGGKSSLGTYWASRMCSIYPGVRGLIGRNELKTLRQTTFLTHMEVMHRFTPLQNGRCNAKCGGHYQVDGQLFEINYCNGSKIIYKELKPTPRDPLYTDLGSMELTFAFLDEATEVSTKAINVVKSRLRYRLEEYNLAPKILLTCNPGFGYMYENYKSWRDGTMPNTKRFIQSLVDDNPYIDPQYIDLLMQLDTATIQRLRFGNWEYGDTAGTFITYEEALDMWTNDFVLDQGGDKWITADIATSGADKFVIMVWEGMAVIKMKVYAKTTAPEIEEILKETANEFGVRRSHIIYDAGGVGEFLKGYLKGATPYIANATPEKMKNKKLNFANLKSQLFWQMGKSVMYIADGQEYKEQINDELIVFKNIKHGTDEKITVQKKEQLKQELGRSPDFAECMVLRMLPIVKPKTKIRVVL